MLSINKKLKIIRKVLHLSVICLFISLISCHEEQRSYIPIINNNLAFFQVNDFSMVRLNSNYEYPRHYYFILEGDEINFLKFIRKTKMLKLTNENVLKDRNLMREYRGVDLWSNTGFYQCEDDTIIREAIDFRKTSYFEYAGYINSELDTIVKESDKHNGKIIFSFQKDKGYIFVELLTGVVLGG